MKDFDKKKNVELYAKDLLSSLKEMIKISDSIVANSIINGWGEGVCIIINDLLNKYLINEGFEFLNPDYREPQGAEEEKLPEINVEEFKLKEDLATLNPNIFSNSEINDEEFFEKNKIKNKQHHGSANSNHTGKTLLIKTSQVLSVLTLRTLN